MDTSIQSVSVTLDIVLWKPTNNLMKPCEKEYGFKGCLFIPVRITTGSGEGYINFDFKNDLQWYKFNENQTNNSHNDS